MYERGSKLFRGFLTINGCWRGKFFFLSFVAIDKLLLLQWIISHIWSGRKRWLNAGHQTEHDELKVEGVIQCWEEWLQKQKEDDLSEENGDEND